MLGQYGFAHVVSCSQYVSQSPSDGGRSRADVALAGLLLPLVH